MKKSRGEGDADDSASILSRLPDEIILQILNKIIDLKSLCCCYLVSRRFSSIVVQVDAITFTPPLLITPTDYVDNHGGILRHLLCLLTISDPLLLPLLSSFCHGHSPFISALNFLIKFRRVKSLFIEFPSSSHIDNANLFKWKVKFGNYIESFSFLLPNSVSDETEESNVYGNWDEEEEEEDDEEEEKEEEEEDIYIGVNNNFYRQNFEISLQCLKDASGWHMMLLYIVTILPMLEKVSITDSGRSGRLSLSGEKLRQVREWVYSASEKAITRVDYPYIMSNCYIPALKLPVSGYEMKGVYLLLMEMKYNQGEYDNSNDSFEGREEAAFTEALKEILEKHTSRMVRLFHGEGDSAYESLSDSE